MIMASIPAVYIDLAGLIYYNGSKMVQNRYGWYLAGFAEEVFA